MVPSQFRRKGGALQVGAAGPGDRGPFGFRPHPLVPRVGEPPSPWPALSSWMEDAVDGHPLWHVAEHQDEPGARAGLDTLDTVPAAVDDALRPAGGRLLRNKIRDFATLRSHRRLLDLRAELTVGAALAAAGLHPALGDTRSPNPDYLVTLPSGARAGVEVTAPAPEGIGELCERIEHQVLDDRPGRAVALAFSRYPSRIRTAAADLVVAAVRDLADAAAEPAVVELPPDVPNDGPGLDPVTVRAAYGPGDGTADWSVETGELTQPMASATFAAFAAGATPARARQGRSQDPAPVLLAADMSRYGSAWMRTPSVWAAMLARSEHFTPDYPFAALVVFRQSTHLPAVLDPAIGINPHLTSSARAQVEELCRTLGWPYA